MTLGACSRLELRDRGSISLATSGWNVSVSQGAKIMVCTDSIPDFKNFFFLHLFFTPVRGLSTPLHSPGIAQDQYSIYQKPAVKPRQDLNNSA
jgi:hypothetical protein